MYCFFFFYGTLLDAEVRRRVLGAHDAEITLAPATLHGWRRVHMRGRTYPVVVPALGEQVKGLLASGVSRVAARRLAAFESDEYCEQDVSVIIDDGKSVTARVFAARSRSVASDLPWTPEEWRQRHRAAFLRRLRRT